MKSISAIHPAITENMEDLLAKHMTISICESHNASIFIKQASQSVHSIISKKYHEKHFSSVEKRDYHQECSGQPCSFPPLFVLTVCSMLLQTRSHRFIMIEG